MTTILLVSKKYLLLVAFLEMQSTMSFTLQQGYRQEEFRQAEFRQADFRQADFRQASFRQSAL